MNGPSRQLPVFVYGTLRPGEKNYPRFLSGRTRGEIPATVSGRLFYVAGEGYPYLVPGPGRVTGDLMELAPDRYSETLRGLDELEEYDPEDEANSVYLRRRVEVRTADGRRRQAWVYYWNHPEIRGEWIESGDFRDAGRGET